MLQSEAGYIDARPHVPQLDEILLQRTAGPYIRVNGRQHDVVVIVSARRTGEKPAHATCAF